MKCPIHSIECIETEEEFYCPTCAVNTTLSARVPHYANKYKPQPSQPVQATINEHDDKPELEAYLKNLKPSQLGEGNELSHYVGILTDPPLTEQGKEEEKKYTIDQMHDLAKRVLIAEAELAALKSSSHMPSEAAILLEQWIKWSNADWSESLTMLCHRSEQWLSEYKKGK